MILKIPVYFEIDIKTHPDRVREIQEIIQILLTKDLEKHHGTKYKWKVSEEKLTFNLVTAEAVRNRLIKNNVKDQEFILPDWIKD